VLGDVNPEPVENAIVTTLSGGEAMLENAMTSALPSPSMSATSHCWEYVQTPEVHSCGAAKPEPVDSETHT
jgi:hypothetical protein